MGSADRPVPVSGRAAPEASLATTVDRLRDELEGLRQAMRSRAAIEQAKGMLMERHGCTPEEAFARLARLSQHANIKLADVAAALVDASQSAPPTAIRSHLEGPDGSAPAPGVTPADVARMVQQQSLARWPRQVSGETEFGSRVRARARRTRVRTELLAAQRFQDVLDAIVRTGLSDLPPSAAALAVVDANGVVTLHAWHGVAPPVAARWHRVPVDLPLPVCAVARTGSSQWLAGERGEPRTLGLGLPETWGTAALLPLRTDTGLGVLALLWPPDAAPSEEDRTRIEALATAAAVAIRRLPSSEPPSDEPSEPAAADPPDPTRDPTVALLEVVFHPVLLCEPVIGTADTVTDLRVVHANAATVDAAGRGPEQLVGRTLLELFPEAVRDGLFEACRQVSQTGVQVDLPRHAWRVTVHGQVHHAVADTRISRYGPGVMITWSELRRRSGGTRERNEARS